MLSKEQTIHIAPEDSTHSGAILPGTPLLLHACCGPCSLEPLKLLREEGFEPTICWTNPNIQPIEEHEHRLKTLLTWAQEVAHVEVIVAGDPRVVVWHVNEAFLSYQQHWPSRPISSLMCAETNL